MLISYLNSEITNNTFLSLNYLFSKYTFWHLSYILPFLLIGFWQSLLFLFWFRKYLPLKQNFISTKSTLFTFSLKNFFLNKFFNWNISYFQYFQKSGISNVKTLLEKEILMDDHSITFASNLFIFWWDW